MAAKWFNSLDTNSSYNAYFERSLLVQGSYQDIFAGLHWLYKQASVVHPRHPPPTK